MTDQEIADLLAICEAADDQDTGSLDAFREEATVGVVVELCEDWLRLKRIEALTERYAPGGFFRLWEQQPQFTLCRDTGLEARGGNCVAHGGDACLFQYVQVTALARAFAEALVAVSSGEPVGRDDVVGAGPGDVYPDKANQSPDQPGSESTVVSSGEPARPNRHAGYCPSRRGDPCTCELSMTAGDELRAAFGPMASSGEPDE